MSMELYCAPCLDSLPSGPLLSLTKGHRHLMQHEVLGIFSKSSLPPLV